MLGNGLKLAVTGCALGLLISLGLTPFLSSQVYGIPVVDPPTFTAMSITLLLISLVACWLPARRAAQVDPMVALRSE